MNEVQMSIGGTFLVARSQIYMYRSTLCSRVYYIYH